ncbi:MAG: precorrin-3B C(17)-methyltransferase, partial [Chromatiales bacterium]|nr:precorrin-3B C(17)-methyltransferase [Chromatiales bacterium]
YGMAGPTYEVLLQAGWTPASDIEVEVVPGSTALSACASLVGAPLTHDFCSISLSDLLTPWPQIARRLEAAAKGDFVIALYNPKSGRRTGQIVEAQRILLQHRSPDTPVAIVKSAYRQKQKIQHVRLDQMSDCDIGMLSTVLIGNKSSYYRAGLMITPRGYENKYENLVGDTHAGEQRGKSLSMGLTGWQECVRVYLKEHKSTSLMEVATYFDVPLDRVFCAINGGSPEALPMPYAATPVDLVYAQRLLDGANGSDNLEVAVSNNSALCCSVHLKRSDIDIDPARIKMVTEQLQLSLDLKSVDQIWLVCSDENWTELYFLNKCGNSLLAILLGG